MLNLVYGKRNLIYNYKIDENFYQLAYRGHFNSLKLLVEEYERT